MTRRSLIAASAGGSLALSAASGATKAGAILELRTYYMRNTEDAMGQRTTDFFKDSYAAALTRAGVKQTGFFGSLIAPDSPFLLTLSSYADLPAWDTAQAKLTADPALRKSLDAYHAGGLGYVRMESTLLRGFETMPNIEATDSSAKRAGRVFEIRTYESNNPVTLARKIQMFNEGEISLFRKLNMTPVFFGETIVGRRMPNLTYMLAYDDLAAREKAWASFVSHPEWDKMKSQPGVSDGEIVSNISNILVRPLPFSAIR